MQAPDIYYRQNLSGALALRSSAGPARILKKLKTALNTGEQQFAMDFLKKSGHTHFEKKSKSVSDQHQTTDATASAVWFCRSFHQYLESKQLLAEPLVPIYRQKC